MDGLSICPPVHEASGFEAEGVHAVFFDGLPWKGKATRAFAYYGIPRVGHGQQVPAMVLVHGGGGPAFAEWVRLWNDRGYAAIAMDCCGCTPGGEAGNRPRHADGGPPGWGGFDQIGEPIEDQWPYHAIGSVILAHTLIRSFPQVDADRIGLTGISWGGYTVCIAAAVDTRFKFAVPVYGCGVLDESGWIQPLAADVAKRWLALWDPAVYLPHAAMPMLWVTGTNDAPYPLDTFRASYRLPPAARSLCIRVRMGHGHEEGWAPEEIGVFADSLLRGGTPLPGITSQGVEDRRVWISFEAESRVTRAELNFTRGRDPWPERHWETVQAELDAAWGRGRAWSTVPDAATACYLSLVDDRDCLVSSEHVEL